MTEEEWQAHITRETAMEIGKWLEARGADALGAPIASLTMADLEAMADRAICRWIVLQSQAPEAARLAEGRPDLRGAHRLSPCVLCGRQGRGFGYCHRLQWHRYPYHRFCSMRCLTAGSALVTETGMIDKTDMEKRAIKAARHSFAEALTEFGLMAPFYHRSAADIDRIIEACVDGFQEAMRRQASEHPFDDPLPL